VKTKWRKLAVIVAALTSATAAQAAFTPIAARGGGDGSERCLTGLRCSGGAYDRALSITRSFEMDLGLAAGTLQRVDDALDGTWSVLGAGAAVLPIARYAADVSRLGVTLPGGGVSFVGGVIADDRVLVRNRVAWLPLGLSPRSQFSFVLDNLSSRLRLASDTELSGFANSGFTQDWMVTWRVPGEDLYLVAWEDRANIGANGLPNDFDYNDYAFAVRGVEPLWPTDPSTVPLPPALGMLGSGLAALGGLALYRRARRRSLSGAKPSSPERSRAAAPGSGTATTSVKTFKDAVSSPPASEKPSARPSVVHVPAGPAIGPAASV
jgi:hypothetical protein